MAGLAAAARARDLGLEVRVLEKGDRVGGSMLLSSCVIWRYRSLEDFREECPGGDPALQQQVIEQLDDALAWLRSLGAPVVWEETGNRRTVGLRFDPPGLAEALLRAPGEPGPKPVPLAPRVGAQPERGRRRDVPGDELARALEAAGC